MPTVKGSKQSRMIVVPYHPWRTLFVRIGVVLAFPATAGAFFAWGTHTAGSAGGDVAEDLAELHESAARSNVQNQALRQQITNLEQASILDKQALSSVQQTILSLRQQISGLEEELLFYKQIMSPESAESGLVIGQLDLVSIEGSGSIRYRLELRQLGNNENVITGHARINVAGMTDGQEIVYSLRDLAAAAVAQDIPLRFRYFQNIEGELTLPRNFEPGRLDVVVAPDGSNDKTVSKSFAWIVQD